MPQERSPLYASSYKILMIRNIKLDSGFDLQSTYLTESSRKGPIRLNDQKLVSVDAKKDEACLNNFKTVKAPEVLPPSLDLSAKEKKKVRSKKKTQH